MSSPVSLASALVRTADWLAAHPDQHIPIFRALTAPGSMDSHIPADADPETLCYCAMGRLAVEMGVDPANAREMYSFKPMAWSYIDTITRLNDRPNPRSSQFGNPDVIPYLRKVAERI